MISTRVGRGDRWCALATVVAISGCVTLSTLSPTAAPPPSGWTQESYPDPAARCSNHNCRSTLKGTSGAIDVTTRAKEYKRHEIPGWNSGVGGRMAGAIVQGIFRNKVGAATERQRFVHGTRHVSETGSGGWRLACRVFFELTDRVESDPEDITGRVAGTTIATQGLDCRAAPLSDTSMIRWRFTRGFAPAFDSIASTYDSLAAQKSALLSPWPPMTLERIGADGTVTDRYEVVRESLVRVRVTRPNRENVALTVNGSPMTLDLAPGISDQELRIARLIAAVLAIPLQ